MEQSGAGLERARPSTMDIQEPHPSPSPKPFESASSLAPETDDREIHGEQDRLNNGQSTDSQPDDFQLEDQQPNDSHQPSSSQPEQGTSSATDEPMAEPTTVREIWGSPRARVGMVAGALAIGLIALIVSWWRASPPPPTDLLAPQATDAGDEAPDVEQQAFRQRQERLSAQAEAEPQPELETDRSAVDLEWVQRLAGRWRLDFGRRAISVVFGTTPAKVLDTDALQLTLFPVSGRGLPPYFTVLRGSEGGSLLGFQNEQGQYEVVLDDLRSHGQDLFSYRIGGTPHRGYGHREGRIGRRPDGPPGEPEFEPFPEREEALPERREPIEITIERQPLEKLWSRAEALKDAGRYDSLEIALERVLVSHPSHRKAERWSRNLSKWRAKQRRNLQAQLDRNLKRLQQAVGRQDLEDVLDLWHAGARSAGRGFFQSFFQRFERTRLRYQLKGSEVDDGTLIFDATLTFEGSDGRQRSLESRPWRGRLVDEYFLDPLPGG